jgi:hypothetical protein
MLNGNLRPTEMPLFQGALFLRDFFFGFKVNAFFASGYAYYAQ